MTSEDTYERHAGTVLVKGTSEINKVSRYILRLLEEDTAPIDILFIGANAGQQTFKVCERVLSRVASKGGKVAFVPRRVLTHTTKLDVTGVPVQSDGANVDEIKDAFVWQVVSEQVTKSSACTV